MRKVKVHKAYEVDAPISAEEASREDGVLTLLHGETQEQLKMRALFRANLVEARETHAVLQSFRDEISQAMADKTKALAIERECLMLGATSDLEVISRDGGLPNDTTLLQGRNALPSTVGGPSPSPPATHRPPPTIDPNQAEMLSDLRNATSRSGQLALSPTKGAPRVTLALALALILALALALALAFALALALALALTLTRTRTRRASRDRARHAHPLPLRHQPQ